MIRILLSLPRVPRTRRDVVLEMVRNRVNGNDALSDPQAVGSMTAIMDYEGFGKRLVEDNV